MATVFEYDKASGQTEDARWAERQLNFAQPFCSSKHSDTLGCAGKFQTIIVLSGVLYRVGVEYQFTSKSLVESQMTKTKIVLRVQTM